MSSLLTDSAHVSASKKDMTLSQADYITVPDVPSFGRIEWEVTHLPFVPPGPEGGVNGMGMTDCGGNVYLFGGHTPAGENADPESNNIVTEQNKELTSSRWSYCYVPETKKWTRLVDMPARREYTRAICADDVLYVVGGAEYHPGGYAARADCFVLGLFNVARIRCLCRNSPCHSRAGIACLFSEKQPPVAGRPNSVGFGGQPFHAFYRYGFACWNIGIDDSRVNGRRDVKSLIGGEFILPGYHQGFFRQV